MDKNNTQELTNYATTLLSNRGFAGYRIKKDMNGLSTEEIRQWHKCLDEVHSAAYDLTARRYNTEGADSGIIAVNKVYNALRDVYALVGELPNGAKLRSDANSAEVVCAYAVTNKSVKSPEMQYKYSQLANSKRYLKSLEEKTGTPEASIAAVKADIAKYEEEIADLKTEEFNLYKRLSKSTASSFYKAMEDFIADMIQKRAILTEEEVQAEKEAQKAARKAKAKASK